MCDVCIMNCEYVSDYFGEMVLALAYPCLFDCVVCRSSTFAMIINLLMRADARGTRGQHGRDWFRCIVYLGWTSCFVGLFFRAMAHVLLCSLVLY